MAETGTMGLIDEIIQEAIKRGDFKDLPGEGAPIKLDDLSTVPEELRLAHKLLKDNDLAPDWIGAGKALDEEYARLRTAARRGVTAALRQQAEAYNKKALTHNLKVPRGVAHKPLFDLKRSPWR